MRAERTTAPSASPFIPPFVLSIARRVCARPCFRNRVSSVFLPATGLCVHRFSEHPISLKHPQRTFGACPGRGMLLRGLVWASEGASARTRLTLPLVHCSAPIRQNRCPATGLEHPAFGCASPTFSAHESCAPCPRA